MSGFPLNSIKPIAAAVVCALVAACGGGQTARVTSTAIVQATPTAEVDAIVALMEDGKVGAAQKRISAGLKRNPNNPSLMMLRDSITKNAKELLGPDSYRYTTQPGDTMALLAQRFLGNRLKFYQLSRYNGIDQPRALQPGQVVNIPGKPPASSQVDRRIVPAQPQRSKPKAAVAPVLSTRPAANPGAAQQARSAGLAALNAGQPARAVNLLSRAASLDPANSVIQRDLARARRIAATVGSK